MADAEAGSGSLNHPSGRRASEGAESNSQSGAVADARS